MEGKFRVENPDDVVFTLEITATAREWSDLRDQLVSKYPSWRLSNMIIALLSQAKQKFYETQKVS